MTNFVEKFPVPLIFKKILKDNLSGQLIVKDSGFSKHFYFQKSDLQYATSSGVEDRLGEILLKTEKITQEQLVMLHRMKEKSEEKFGKLLVKLGIMDKQSVFQALQDQVKTIATSTFYLSTGQWSFKLGEPDISDNPKYKIDLREIIIDGCRQLIDFSYYKQRFEYLAPVTLPIPESSGPLLSPDDIRFYLKLSKCNIVSTSHIFSIMDMEENEFWHRIAMLYLLNCLDFTEFKIGSKIHENLERLEDLHGKLKANTLDHYQLLELKDTSSVSEVRDRYFSFTKKFDQENIEAPPDSEAMEKVEYIIERATEALDTLTDENKKKAYDTGEMKKVEPPPAPTGEISKRTGPEKAKNLYLKAHSLFEESRYHEAARLLEEAVQLDDNRASYHLLLGLIQSKIPEFRPYAEKNLQKAAKMEPWNADPVFYLGQLYWMENLVKKAEREFRKALEINMEHTLAAKMINKIEKQLKKPTFSLFTRKH